MRQQVKVGIVGVGNCAASLVQGVHYYADADPAARQGVGKVS
jgi:myo-inositol-1-phosphate synthase